MTTFIKIGGTEYNAEDYTIPAERTFREGWQIVDGNTINVNMSEAKNIWKNKIREARKSEFLKLDALYMKALESSDTDAQTSIATQKQALRDAPSHSGIDNASTPDELKAVQPIPNVTIE